MKQYRNLLIMILLSVFVISTGMTLREQQSAQTGTAAYTDAVEIATQPTIAALRSVPPPPPPMSMIRQISDDPNAELLLNLNLTALQQINADVIGWIFIPNTNISYPIVQGRDNQHYLDYTWDNRKSYVGSVFMECTNDPEFSDFNTILYAHNLKKKTMFSHLHKYKSQEFWEENPYVYIVTPSGAYRYQIFTAFEVPTTASCYRIRFSAAFQKNTMLTESMDASILETGITPSIDDRILTLSTCTGVIKTNRWVVQAQFQGQIIAPVPVPSDPHQLR